MNNDKSVRLVPNFIDEELRLRLLEQDVQPPAGRHDVSAEGLPPEVVWRISDLLRAQYGIDGPLFCDYAAATASRPGMGHVLHADAETLEGEPNHTAWRKVTAMLYLNSQGPDFAGGSLLFPRLGIEVRPRAGLLVGFRCDGIHAHRVPPVTRGVRRALAFWFTTNRSFIGRVAPR